MALGVTHAATPYGQGANLNTDEITTISTLRNVEGIASGRILNLSLEELVNLHVIVAVGLARRPDITRSSHKVANACRMFLCVEGLCTMAHTKDASIRLDALSPV